MTSRAATVNEANVTRWHGDSDVIVIGFGIAGACAALEARRAGADVLVIEGTGGGGGTSAVSCGIFYLGGGTPVQTACGYADSADNMFRYLDATIAPHDPEALRAFCDGSVEHFHWLEAQGVPFERTGYDGKAMFLMTTECLLGTGNEAVWPFRDVADPVPRGHAVAEYGETAGAAAMRALMAQCEAAGVRTRYDSRVTDLFTDGDSRIVGVRARHAGADYDFRARQAVIITAGGFSCNEAMVKQHFPNMPATAAPFGIPTNDGSGLLLGQAAGGVLDNMDGIIGTASFYPPAQLIKGILVNLAGERFVAEDSYHGRTAAHILQQPDQRAYLIVDNAIFAYPELDFTRHALVDGWETVTEMEAGLSLPAGSLVRTLTQYNEGASNGDDALFHKHPDWLQPLAYAPYAAFDVSFNRSTYLYLMLGGLRTNRFGQVLDPTNEPVRALYAAGGSAAHLPRDGMSYASGLSLATGSFFGRQAGRHAVTQQAKPSPP